MLINLSAKSLLFFFISSKKFHAKTNAQSAFPLILSLDKIGIFIPGKYLPCLNLLSSTIQSISFEIPKRGRIWLLAKYEGPLDIKINSVTLFEEKRIWKGISLEQ